MTAPLEILRRAHDLHHKEAGIFQQAEPRLLLPISTPKDVNWLRSDRPLRRRQRERGGPGAFEKLLEKLQAGLELEGGVVGRKDPEMEKEPPPHKHTPWLLPGAQADER